MDEQFSCVTFFMEGSKVAKSIQRWQIVIMSIIRIFAYDTLLHGVVDAALVRVQSICRSCVSFTKETKGIRDLLEKHTEHGRTCLQTFARIWTC